MIPRIGNLFIYRSYKTQKIIFPDNKKACVIKYSFNACLNCCLLFSNFIMWGAKLLKTLIPKYVTPFWMEEKETVDLCRWFFCLEFTECTDRFVWNWGEPWSASTSKKSTDNNRAILNNNKHPCPLCGSVGCRHTFCNREITYTVTKVHLDWLVHLKSRLVSLGTPALAQHTGFTVVGLYYSSASLDLCGLLIWGNVWVKFTSIISLHFVWGKT